MNQPNQYFCYINNTRLNVYEWNKHNREKSPTLVMIHATGFHGRCWDEVIRYFPEYHVIAMDQRGHGLSENTSFDGWRVFADDLVALLNHLDVSHAIAIGHSMGGHNATMAAALAPQLFSRLLLIDPVILSPQSYQQHVNVAIPPVSDHPIARRRRYFDSVEDALNRYHSRTPYNIFTPQALLDYFNFGLIQTEQEAGVGLACLPETEARIYQTVFSNPAIVDAIDSVDIPVVVVRAMQAKSQEQMMSDFRFSPTWNGLAMRFKQGEDILLNELTHFMPMEAPERVARLIKEHMLLS